MRAEGYEVTPGYDDAALVIVNTCGFIDAAVEESLDAIGEAMAENGKVIVTGCLGVRQEVIRQAYPDVLAVSGPQALDQVMQSVHEQLARPHDPYPDLLPPGGIKLTPRHYAYLKIAEGCNHQCTFCIIPSLRGKLVSRPVASVLEEAGQLAEAGVKELLIISQDTAAYGVDMKYHTEFWRGRPIQTRMTELARALSEFGIWIRLHYVYPYPHIDELIPLMAEEKILPYLDVPLQHASPRVLKAMKRPGDIEKMLERIGSWRAECPELTIRSTFIVGFPGETEMDFDELLSFIKQAQLDRVGAFMYSPVEGAKANKLADAVPEQIKQERLQRFMAVQEEISKNKLKTQIGKTLTVLVDEISDEGAVARSKADAPEIDGVVYIESGGGEKIGEFSQVTITDSDSHDLFAHTSAN